jgi:ATP-dependent DNA helicase PIF1
MTKDLLNAGQEAAYDSIEEGKSIFLTGSGGTGKSFLLNLLYTLLPKQTGRKVALTALTGCASLLLHPKAKTIHSWAGIGLGTDPVELLVPKVKKSNKARTRWMGTDVLVIDEISMMTPELFEKLDQVGRKVRCNESTPFGGLQLVLVGDFYQLPPVVRNSETTSFVFESPLWKDLRLTMCELTEIVRQKDAAFQTVLNEARIGQLTKSSLRILVKRMGLDYKTEKIQPTMLFTRRAQVDTINMKYLKELTSERRSFKANTVFDPVQATKGMTDKDPYIQEAVQKLDMNASYTPDLVLAIGAQVMLVTNLKPQVGLVNGSRGVIVAFEPAKCFDEKEKEKEVSLTDSSLLLPIVEFRNGQKEQITPITWEVPDMPAVKRQQIPLKLAYAITIHKSQGATLDCALIDVGSKTFEYGQAYVALSRVKDLESLYIHDLDPQAFRAHPKVKEFYEASKPIHT